MIGKTLSHFYVVEKIGSGGMGIVYKAVDQRLGRDVALKFLPPTLIENENYRRRFIAEAIAASRLNHPNICPIYDIGETKDGQLFIVMAYCPGQTVKEKLAAGPLPIDEALHIAIQVADALAAAHDKGIVHRDIKPANIIVSPEGIARVVDFGLAKLKAIELTASADTLGTPAYMSPEQIQGQLVDERTDIWSLGVVLYEMLTGQLPFAGTTPQAVMHAITHSEPIPPHKLRPEIPQALETLVLRTLEKLPEKRFRSMRHLLKELRRVQVKLGELASLVLQTSEQSQLTATIPVRHRRTWRPAVRGLRKWQWTTTSAVLILLVSLLLFHQNLRTYVLSQICQTFQLPVATCTVPPGPHLAVVPFHVESQQPEDQILAAGLYEDLVRRLRSILTAAENFCVHPVPARDQAYGIPFVLTARLVKNENAVTVEAFLVNQSNGLTIRKFTVTRNQRELPVLEDRFLEQASEILGLKLSSRQRIQLAGGSTALAGAFESYLLGLGYLRVGRAEEAEKWLQQALQVDPFFARAHTALGDLYAARYVKTRRQQWLDLAEKAYLKAIEYNEELATSYTGLARIYTTAGRYEEAIAAAQQALNLDPSNIDARRELARAYEASCQLDKAEAVMKELAHLRTSCWILQNSLGVFYWRHGRYEEAAEQFRHVIATAPDCPVGYNNLGAVMDALDQLDEAIQAYQRSIELDPRASSYNNLGRLLFRQGKYREAVEAFLKAVELGENNYLQWSNLAEAYLMIPEYRDRAPGAFRQAISLAEAALDANPNDERALTWLAYDQARLWQLSEGSEKEHWDKARRYAERALRLNPTNVDVLYRTALAYELLGERQLALRYLEQALLRGFSLKQVEQEDVLAKLRSDPAYRELASRVHHQQLSKHEHTKPACSS